MECFSTVEEVLHDIGGVVTTSWECSTISSDCFTIFLIVLPDMAGAFYRIAGVFHDIVGTFYDIPGVLYNITRMFYDIKG